MTSTFALRFRRPIVTLLCAQLLLTASGATELPPVGQRDAQRPPPSSAANLAVPQMTRAMPNFEAPSATHCARPIQTVETPGVVDARTELTITADDSSAGRYFGARSESHELRKPMPSAASAAKADAAPAAAAVAGPAPVTPAPTGTAPPMPVAPTVQAVPPAPGMSPPPPPAPPPPPPTKRAAPSTAAVATPSGRLAIGTPPPQSVAPARPANEPVTAGMVDDNADFREYLDFRNRTMVPHRERDISQRYLLQVRDARGTVVPDAEVAVQAANGAAMWARTDAGGRAWLHPNAFDASASPVYEVTVRKAGRQATAFLQRGQKNAVDVTLAPTGAAPSRARLDLVFLIDATGSMDDEIAKLKTTLHTIADEVAKLPSRPDTCFGLVAYRDRGDQFLVRRHDFTNDLGAFQGVLDALQAGGGGDYPEAMNEALNMTVHKLSWRGDGATRLVVLLADAPPHLDYGGPQYDDDMVAALGKGIKVLSVGASGLDKQGEYIQRQIAQYTGGRFVFLTYDQATNPASGPGTKTVHDVGNYSVQTLDRLIVRLVSEELGKLPTANNRGG